MPSSERSDPVARVQRAYRTMEYRPTVCRARACSADLAQLATHSSPGRRPRLDRTVCANGRRLRSRVAMGRAFESRGARAYHTIAPRPSGRGARPAQRGLVGVWLWCGPIRGGGPRRNSSRLNELHQNGMTQLHRTRVDPRLVRPARQSSGAPRVRY